MGNRFFTHMSAQSAFGDISALLCNFPPTSTAVRRRKAEASGAFSSFIASLIIRPEQICYTFALWHRQKMASAATERRALGTLAHY